MKAQKGKPITVRKAIIVDNCLECPMLKCGPSKALKPKQRFVLQTGVGVGKFILKGCPLVDFPE